MPGARLAIWPLVALLLAAAAPAAAQVPVVPLLLEENYLLVDLNLEDAGMKEVEYLGQVDFRFVLHDLSRDSTLDVQGSDQGLYHQTIVTTQVLPYVPPGADAANFTQAPLGWAAGGGTAINTVGGQSVPFVVQVKTSGAVVDNYVRVRVIATTSAPHNGTEVQAVEEIVVKLAPFHAGRLLMKEAPLRAGQYKTVHYPVEITNLNTYHEAFRLNASAPAGWVVSAPTRVILEPRETRTVNLTIVTPHERVFDLGTPGTILVQMWSENEPLVVYTSATTVVVFGPYVPSYWWPMGLLGLLGAAVVVGRTRERVRIANAERGRPRRPRPTPRETALLAELKRRDPEAYQAKMATYTALYAERKRYYREHRREERARERAEARESHRLAEERRRKERELQRARRALERARDQKARQESKVEAAVAKRAAAEAAKRAKVDAKLARKEAKARAKRDAAEAKERAKLEKKLAAKRKELEAAARKAARELEKARKATEKRKG